MALDQPFVHLQINSFQIVIFHTSQTHTHKKKKNFKLYFLLHLLVSVLLALAPPPALRDPLDDEEPNESEEELLMLSLSWPLPQEDAAHPPLSGRRLSVGELSDVVSGALLSMLAMPERAQYSRVNTQTNHTNM